MRPSHNERRTTAELRRSPISQEAAMMDIFNSMTVEEIRNSKPKSRLESFLRRKALEKKVNS